MRGQDPGVVVWHHSFCSGGPVNSTSYIKKVVNCAMKVRLAKSLTKCCKTHLNISV